MKLLNIVYAIILAILFITCEKEPLITSFPIEEGPAAKSFCGGEKTSFKQLFAQRDLALSFEETRHVYLNLIGDRDDGTLEIIGHLPKGSQCCVNLPGEKERWIFTLAPVNCDEALIITEKLNDYLLERYSDSIPYINLRIKRLPLDE